MAPPDSSLLEVDAATWPVVSLSASAVEEAGKEATEVAGGRVGMEGAVEDSGTALPVLDGMKGGGVPVCCPSHRSGVVELLTVKLLKLMPVSRCPLDSE